MEIERDLSMQQTEEPKRLEVDILKILTQLGIDQEKWLIALKEPSE